MIFKSIKLIILFGGLGVLFFVIACSNPKTIKVKGRLENGAGSSVQFIEMDVDKDIIIDSAKIRGNGKFHFSTISETPKFYKLAYNNAPLINLLAYPGQEIEIAGNVNQAGQIRVDGSSQSTDLMHFEKQLKRLTHKLDSVNQLAIDAQIPQSESLLLQQQLLKDYKRNSKKYIIEHPASMVSMMLLYQQYAPGYFVFNKATDLQFFKIVSDSLGKAYPASRHVKALQGNTELLLEDFNSARLNNMLQQFTTNNRLPEIKLTDFLGDTLKLSDYRGKYTLIMFWNTNIPENRSYNLALKDIYKKYGKRQFEIYQVATDKNRTAWRRAVLESNLPWPSVIDTKNGYYAGLYNVKELPYSLLINPDHTDVLARDLTITFLDNKLKELLAP